MHDVSAGMDAAYAVGQQVRCLRIDLVLVSKELTRFLNGLSLPALIVQLAEPLSGHV